MKDWKITYENGDVVYITMDAPGIANMWIHDPYIKDIRQVRGH